MISKLPRWVWGGAWVLAFIAGMVNAVGILGLEHQSVSHLTGTTTLLGIGIAQGDTAKVVHFLLLLGAFLTGTAISGLLIEDTALKLGRRYPVALLLQAALLTAAAFLLRNQHVLGHYLASCSCGLQNAMITTYSGTVVRTTHVSGMFTDLGISLGHALRRHPVDFRRVRLSGIVISGFLCGAAAGAAGYSKLGPFTLLIPAGITAFVAVAYGWRTMRGRGPGYG